MTLGFYFNQQNCSGCRTCQIACCDRNGLPVGTLFRRVSTFETGEYPHADVYHYSATCNHCEKPQCVANCPQGAMQKIEDGTVQREKDACIGCGTCVKACPYEVPVLLEEGVSGKCDSCKALRDAGLNPACVDACPMRALDFGDMEALVERYGAGLVKDIAPLPASDETGPSIAINARPSASEDSYKLLVI